MEADPNGPEGINPAIDAKVLRWAAAVVLKEPNPETEELAESWDQDGPAIDEVFSDVLDRPPRSRKGAQRTSLPVRRSAGSSPTGR